MSGSVRREAATIREEWLGRALSTRPADRPVAEAAISGLYRLIGLDPPRFHWVPSPLTAVETVPPGSRLRPLEAIDRVAEWPVPRALAVSATELRLALDERIARTYQGLDGLIRQQVALPLAQSSRDVVTPPLRAAHGARSFNRGASRWYDQLSASWVARYDAIRAAAGTSFTAGQNRQVDLWAAALSSSGPWWPREHVCTVSERPVTVRTEVSGEDGEVRPHCEDGPAIRYADGWDLYAWHGMPVPSWVIDDPAAWRIEGEANVEVRRCAIERAGWPSYIREAGLRLVASAPDPGNPGAELRLYDLREDSRVLLAVNGSVERDGHRRQYGLTVPRSISDPVAAAAWTYDLSAEQYSTLLRRT